MLLNKNISEKVSNSNQNEAIKEFEAHVDTQTNMLWRRYLAAKKKLKLELRKTIKKETKITTPMEDDMDVTKR